MSTVSVVVPRYNNAHHIARTMDSILRQTFPDFEVVVSDHSSTDGTWELLQPYCDDPRVRAYSAADGAVEPRQLGRREPPGARALPQAGVWGRPHLPECLSEQVEAWSLTRTRAGRVPARHRGRRRPTHRPLSRAARPAREGSGPGRREAYRPGRHQRLRRAGLRSHGPAGAGRQWVVGCSRSLPHRPGHRIPGRIARVDLRVAPVTRRVPDQRPAVESRPGPHARPARRSLPPPRGRGESWAAL